MNRQNLLVVVPALNEQESISAVIAAVKSVGFQVLVVDDGSSDETYSIAKRSGAQVMELSMNLGVGGALQSGFAYAVANGFDAVVQVDGDDQHSAESIEKLIAAANSTNADMVVGSRFLDGASSMKLPIVRRIGMAILRIYASRSCRTKITDSSSGFRLIRNPLLAEFAKSFPSHYLGDTFEALTVSGKKNYKVIEIPAPFRERQFGKSSSTSLLSLFLVFRALFVVTFGLHFRLSKNSQTRAD
ncbi:glycosyl transferase family 2 [Actinomycetes bacterium]|nr:glycosyl transferase family 2 [Actinomycetes bacterium]